MAESKKPQQKLRKYICHFFQYLNTFKHVKQIPQMKGFNGCCNVERIYLPLSFFSLNQHSSNTHQCLQQLISQPTVISQLYNVYTYYIILVRSGQRVGLKGVFNQAQDKSARHFSLEAWKQSQLNQVPVLSILCSSIVLVRTWSVFTACTSALTSCKTYAKKTICLVLKFLNQMQHRTFN